MTRSEVAAIGAREAATASHPSQPHATEGHHVYERHLEGVDDPASQIRVTLQHKELRIHVKGSVIETIPLPETAFTDLINAQYQRGTLSIKVAAKNPQSPAMQEKQVFDPDNAPVQHPRDIDVRMPGHKPLTQQDKPQDAVGHGAKTPAQASMGAGQPRAEGIQGPPDPSVQLPEAGLAGTVATDNPVVARKGGALEAFDGGETVVRDRDAADSKLLVPREVGEHVAQVTESLGRMDVAQGAEGESALAGLTGPGATEEAKKLAAGTERGWVPPGTTVVFGERDHQLELEHGTATKQYAEAAAHAAAPAGGGDSESEYEYYETYSSSGSEAEHVPVDFAKNKVSMETEVDRAADHAPRADDHNYRPAYTSLNDQIDAAEQGERLPAMRPPQPNRAGGSYEMSAAETKRSGKPKLKKRKKAVTGANHHVARDFRMHAKPLPETKARAGQRDAEGRVTFEFSDEAPTHIARAEQEELHMGSSLRRPAKAAAHAQERSDEGREDPKAWHNTHTGGRQLPFPANQTHLSSGKHEAPRTLG